MNNIPWDELLQRLDAIGAKLGVVGSQVYGLAVRQAVIKGTLGVVFCGLIVLVCVGLGIALLKESFKGAEERDGNYSSSYWIVDVQIFGLFLLGMAVISGIFLGDALTKLLNPGFAAIYEILEMVK